MDFSPDAVFDLGPWTYGKDERRKAVLWPVEIWRVAVPLTRRHKLNLLQRVVLRLHIAGQTEYAAIAHAVDAEPELIAHVADELRQMNALDAQGNPGPQAEKFLDDDAPPEPEETRVGFIFRDRVSGKLLGRFALDLTLARVEASSSDKPVLLSGTKGDPRREYPFVVSPGGAWGPPTPGEIRDAIGKHLLDARRFKRAGVFKGLDAPRGVRRIGRLIEAPVQAHLRTFVEIPQASDTLEPWLVADPFGFGHHVGLRAALEGLRAAAGGGLRDRLDQITGMDDRDRLTTWEVMNEMLREEGLTAAILMLQTHRGKAFEAFAEAGMLIARAEHAEQKTGRIDLNSAYQRLRVAVEFSLIVAFERFPPGDAWHKVKDLPGRDVGRTIAEHADKIGFGGKLLPDPVRRASINHLRAVCDYEPSGRIRPSLAALILAATDVPDHAMRRLAQAAPEWLNDINNLASAAGDAVHQNSANDLGLLKKHRRKCADALNALESAMG